MQGGCTAAKVWLKAMSRTPRQRAPPIPVLSTPELRAWQPAILISPGPLGGAVGGRVLSR